MLLVVVQHKVRLLESKFNLHIEDRGKQNIHRLLIPKKKQAKFIAIICCLLFTVFLKAHNFKEEFMPTAFLYASHATFLIFIFLHHLLFYKSYQGKVYD